MRPNRDRRVEIEDEVRECVVGVLGVGEHELCDDYLIDDRATVDSLTLLEVVVAMEDALHIVVPEREIGRLRTFGDFVRLATRLRDEENGAMTAPALRLRKGLRGTASLVTRTGGLTRATELDPYDAETILEDALAAGPASSVDLFVAPATSDEIVADLERLFDRVRRRGIEVHVMRRLPDPTADAGRRAEAL
jgi:acyl carrier protein